MNAANLKTAVIAVLCILVAAQAAWIVQLSPLSGSSPAAPAIKEARVSPDRSGFEIELSAPVDTKATAAQSAAALKPELKGEWLWSNPYELRFKAEQPVPQNREFTVTLAPELGLSGETQVTLRTGTFELEQIDLSEQAGDKPGTAVIRAVVRFNGPVSPEDLLENVTLTDQSDDSAIPLQVMTSWSSRRLELLSQDISKTTGGRTYRLTVGKDLQRSGTELTLDRDASADIAIRLDPVLHYQGADPWSSASGGGIRLTFSTPMEPKSAAPFVSVAPQADYSLAADGKTLLLDGGFKPGSKYTVTVRKGLTAADGAELDKDQTVSLMIPDMEPSVSFVGSGMFLPRHKGAGLALEAVNADRITVRVDRIYPNNIFNMLHEYGWRVFEDNWDYSGVPYAFGGKLHEQTIPVAGKPNQPRKLPLQLYDLVGSGERGLFKVSAAIPGKNGVKRWLMLTDIGLVAKRDEHKFTVWAVSNTTLEPLSGIRLTLVSDKNQILARSGTNASGVGQLRVPANNSDGSAYMILAERKGGDFTFLLPSRFGVDTTGLDVNGVTASPTGLRAFLYGERDLYRPGETLNGMVVVRKDSLAAPPSLPLSLVQRDPKGREIRSIWLKTDADGTAAFELPIPDYALTGGHSLTLKAGDRAIGTFDFKVEEFIPDRIKVTVSTERDSFLPGQSITANIQSSYLFGPPASDLPVTARAMLRSAPFTASGYEDYAFGNPERSFEPQEIFSEDGSLNKDGKATFDIALPDGLTPPAALEAMLYGRVSESGGRGVTARKRVTIHPYDYYIGIKKLNKNGFKHGQPITFDFTCLTPQGAKADHGPLTARLYRDRYRTVVRKAPSGGFRYESVNDPQLLTETAIAAGSGDGTVEFTPPRYGSYRVVISSPETGASALTTFYSGGWGYSPWALENPARVELVTDKEQYQPGETATVQVRAPFPGKLLVTVEGNYVNDTRIIDLHGNTGEVRLPVKQAYAPNVHITATLLRKASNVGEGSVGRAFGAIPLLVDNLSNKMTLDIETAGEVRPEAELPISVQAEPGAVVTIAAVDEGIMQLSGSDDPDPFDFFYARRALGVASSDTFAMLYPDLARVMGASDAGGGMAMMAESRFMRTEGIRRVKPVSFWSGPLTAGSDGVVRYTAKLPDFQGALRIVAVGLDGKRFGTSRAMTRVRSPLALTPTLPRFMATGDSIEMPVTVRNDLGKDAAISVSVVAEGAAMSTAKPASLQLGDGAEETIYVPITASEGAGGKATITVTAKSGDESRSVTTDLPVRPAIPYKRENAFGSLNKPEGQLVDQAEGYVPGTVTRSVTLSRMPTARFAGKLRHLLRYPYGCAEQTTSKAFPLIRFGKLAQAFAPELMQERSPAFMVQSAIMRLVTMQTGNGGFGFWPGADAPEAWVSAYMTHFLLEAKQAGYTSPGMLQRALGYMSTLATKRANDLNPTAYALFTLAKAGHPDRGSMDELRDKRLGKLTPLGRTLLACAYALSGDMESFNALLAELPEVKEAREPGGRMGSGLRDNALMLLALADANPGDRMIPKLTQTVSRLMTATRWGTTQENALAFAAVGKAMGLGDPSPLSGSLTAGDADHPFADVSTFTIADINGAGPISATLEGDNATAYWSVTTRGVPDREDFKPEANGIEVRRTLLDRTGKPVDAASVEQGTLLIMKTEIRSSGNSVENVVVQALLPAGLEVENPRLESSEVSAFAPDEELSIEGHQDLRDDRVLFFTDLKRSGWHAGYTQLRAVTPGSYALPPVQAEAMYDPSIMAVNAPGELTVTRK